MICEGSSPSVPNASGFAILCIISTTSVIVTPPRQFAFPGSFFSLGAVEVVVTVVVAVVVTVVVVVVTA